MRNLIIVRGGAPTSPREFVESVLADYPQCADVEVRSFVPENEFDAGGYYDFDIDQLGNVTPVLYISDLKPEEFRSLLTIRRTAVALSAKLLNIPSEQLTPTILQLFIVAHELGHIYDFKTNYSGHYGTCDADAVVEMDLHRNMVLDMLPVPGIDPTHFIAAIHTIKNLDEVLEKYPMIRKCGRFPEITSLESLIRIQEEEYRKSAPEAYADEFAKHVLIGSKSIMS